MKRNYLFRLKIKQLLEDRNMTQRDLADMTGLREAAISEMINGTRTVINKSHIAKIMDALDLTDLNDILELKIEIEF